MQTLWTFLLYFWLLGGVFVPPTPPLRTGLWRKLVPRGWCRWAEAAFLVAEIELDVVTLCVCVCQSMSWWETQWRTLRDNGVVMVQSVEVSWQQTLHCIFDIRYVDACVYLHHARRSLSTVGGTHSGQSTPPLLSSSHSPSFSPPRNGVRSHSRCGTE